MCLVSLSAPASLSGRLYKAVLRPKANVADLPAWVTVEASKRDERRRAEEESEREGEAALEAAAAAGAKPSDAAAASSATPSHAASSLSSPSLSSSSSSLVSLLHETVVIKEVPFNGLPPQEQQDILNEVTHTTLSCAKQKAQSAINGLTLITALCRFV